MLQQLIVGLIVLTAMWVVARKYMPKRLRRRMAGATAHLLRRVGLERGAGWLEKELPSAASCGDGCGSCGSCGAGAAGTGPARNEFSMTPDELRRTIRRP